MASIRSSGGSGLRKVKDADKRDRSAAAVPGSANENPAPPPSGDSSGGMMAGLQDALNKRKQKVSASGKFSLFPGLFVSIYVYRLALLTWSR